MKEKNLSIELLRILSMYMIVLLHYLTHGNILINFTEYKLSNQICISFLEIISIISVNIFVFISSYFLMNKKDTKKYIIKSFLELWFVNFIIVIIYILKLRLPVSIDLIKMFFPFISQTYWFMDAYILLLIFIPYINKMLNSLSKKELLGLILIMFFTNSIFSFIPNITIITTTANSLSWFINIFIITYYLKKYKISIEKRKMVVFHFLYITIMVLLFFMVCKYFNKKYPILIKYNNPLILCDSIVIFKIFLDKKIKVNTFFKKIILYLSSNSLYVYLISDHPIMREIIWKRVKNQFIYDCSNLFVYCFIIYILCILTGYLFNLFIKFIIRKIVSD